MQKLLRHVMPRYIRTNFRTMINGKKVIVVIPAYNGTKTVARGFHQIPRDIVDDIVLMDVDAWKDSVRILGELGIRHIIRHLYNAGYGGHVKSDFQKAMELDADIVVVLHPDYPFTPMLIASTADIIANGDYPVVIGSRPRGEGTRKGDSPLWEYHPNLLLTKLQNFIMNERLSEYHTGYRVISREVLENINFEANCNNWVFDKEILAQVFWHGYEIAEVTCPTKYFEEASSANFANSLKYGSGCMRAALQYRLCKWGLMKSPIFDKPDLMRFERTREREATLQAT